MRSMPPRLVVATGLIVWLCLPSCTRLKEMAMPGKANAVYVAPDGSDENPGTRARPFRTLERARDAARELAKQGAATVVLRGGVYERQTTFELTREDSGTADARVTWRAAEGETVRLVGGKAVTQWQPVSDAATLQRLDPAARGHVLQADLKTAGIADCGAYGTRFRTPPPTAELFFNNQRMTLARWPNGEWAAVKKIIEQGSRPRHGDKGSKPGTFEYDGDRPARWASAPAVWLCGYWCFDWYEETIKVGRIDTATRRITFAAPHYYGLRQGNPGPRRYYALNLLEELDSPGEYFIDGKSGTLYFWPPSPVAKGRAVVSAIDKPVVSLTGVSHVTLRGLTVEACRGTAIAVSEGREVQLVACTVRNTGHGGIAVHGGERHRVEACDIHHTGTSGLVLRGGDRKTLTPAGHQAVNNHIHHFARRQRTYAAAIHIGGVGNRIAHCLLHDAPHTAILLGGNDHLIELNEVHHVCVETDDCGAFYMGRNPSHRGNVLRHNFWHHIGSPRGHGNNGIYFDDGDGGSTVFGNVLLRCGNPGRSSMGALFVHGGHDNLFENNILIECKRAIGASPWNDKRWNAYVKAPLWQTRLLKEVDITKPPYITRYPQLKGFMEPSTKPRMNTAVRNVAVMCGAFARGNYTLEHNLVLDEDPGFVDAAAGNFALKPGSVVFQKIPGFQPIPFDRIGLVRDANRPTLPERTWAYPPPKPLPKAESPKSHKRTTPPPVFKVPPVQGPVAVEGADPKRAISLAQDLHGRKASPTSRAWLGTDGVRLFVAIDNTVAPSTALRRGHQWGRDDAIEIALRNPAAGKNAPTFVLRGYPDGHFESSSEAGAPATAAQKAGKAVKFAAKVVSKSRWTATCAIPFAALGIDPAKHKRLQCNLTVRKAASDLWLMWQGTRGYSWKVANAGLLELPR